MPFNAAETIAEAVDIGGLTPEEIERFTKALTLIGQRETAVRTRLQQFATQLEGLYMAATGRTALAEAMHRLLLQRPGMQG